ncbi:hypothetical protein [Massilia sp. 9096]|uniref:hypothetical protein n=1 Tax=Massilia sp. 9096 TaxID=1500894 RepID=UPI00056C6A0C|nr:hypothetical protein [Massilia sp. 9096]
MMLRPTMKIVLSCIALALTACTVAPTQAQKETQMPTQTRVQMQTPTQQEALFVARVERISLAPRGGMACPELCPSKFTRNEDGSTEVCIADDGGCQKTEVQVERVLLGTVQPGPYSFDGRIGEWSGSAHFPVTHTPILVHVRPGLVEWAPVTSKDGQQQVRLKAFRFGVVAGVDLGALARDEGDAVTLDAVAQRLAAAPH